LLASFNARPHSLNEIAVDPDDGTVTVRHPEVQDIPPGESGAQRHHVAGCPTHPSWRRHPITLDGPAPLCVS
jgi:hypothetical protein